MFISYFKSVSLSGPKPELTFVRPISSLIAPSVVLSLLGQVLLNFAFQLLTYALLIHQSWFVPLVPIGMHGYFPLFHQEETACVLVCVCVSPDCRDNYLCFIFCITRFSLLLPLLPFPNASHSANEENVLIIINMYIHCFSCSGSDTHPTLQQTKRTPTRWRPPCCSSSAPISSSLWLSPTTSPHPFENPRTRTVSVAFCDIFIYFHFQMHTHIFIYCMQYKLSLFREPAYKNSKSKKITALYEVIFLFF